MLDPDDNNIETVYHDEAKRSAAAFTIDFDRARRGARAWPFAGSSVVTNKRGPRRVSLPQIPGENHVHTKLQLPAMLLLAFMAGSPADATAARRIVAANAGAICQPALPSGAGSNIRIRPLAVLNEGATTAFVTCAFDGGATLYSPHTQDVGLGLINKTGAQIAITCTLVDGYDLGQGADAEYITRTTQVGANSGNLVTFSVDDLAGTPAAIFFANVSCSLPPGTGIGVTQHDYDITLED